MGEGGPLGEVATWSNNMLDVAVFDECRFMMDSSMYYRWYFGDRIKELRDGTTARLSHMLYLSQDQGWC
ncbi:conserved hypothetical protein [Ricinus communis]|uniref:Uncharacterized protein n=1 Tax=Ricinus communis TaxID=3988 RepID=B9RWX2_RICCO|nr:conserved hypothetical protein [Ricinus communis]